MNKYINAINKSRAEAFTEAFTIAFAEGRTEGFTEGRAEERKLLINNMLRLGKYTYESIAEICDCSVSFVEDVAKTI